MSAQPVLPLQDRILGLLQQHGGIRAKDVERYVTGVDRGAIDAALTGLLKQSRATLALGMYEIVKPGAKKPVEYLASVLPQDPPNAMAEAAASLVPVETQVCKACGEPKALAFFRVTGGGRHKTCNTCVVKQRAANMASNTPTAPTTVSLESAHDKEPPAAADHAAGPASLAEALHTVLHGPDVTPLPTSSLAFQDMLEAKRLALIARIEEAEALVERLKGQLVELDRAVAGLRVVMPEVFG